MLFRSHVSDLRGDIWSNFTIGRLTVSDPEGVWLEVDRLGVRWRMAELFERRFHAEAISADQVRIFRRPTLGPAPPPSSGEAPLALAIDSIRFDIATPLNPDKGDPAIQIYLSIGQSF